MISWDEYQEEGTTVAKATPVPEVVNEVIKQSVTHEQKQREKTSSEVSETKSISPEGINQSADKISAAANIVANMDVSAGLEELEQGAKRIEVDQKKMINCRADLNQLVPLNTIGLGKNISMAVLTIGCLKK